MNSPCCLQTSRIPYAVATSSLLRCHFRSGAVSGLSSEMRKMMASSRQDSEQPDDATYGESNAQRCIRRCSTELAHRIAADHHKSAKTAAITR